MKYLAIIFIVFWILVATSMLRDEHKESKSKGKRVNIFQKASTLLLLLIGSLVLTAFGLGLVGGLVFFIPSSIRYLLTAHSGYQLFIGLGGLAISILLLNICRPLWEMLIDRLRAAANFIRKLSAHKWKL